MSIHFQDLREFIEHLRQHERVTHEERRLQERVLTLLEPGTQPLVRHFVGAAAEGLKILAKPAHADGVLG